MARWILFFLCSLTVWVAAEVVIAESLEWRTASSPQVGLYQVQKVERADRGEAKFTIGSVFLNRVEVLKGKPPERTSLSLNLAMSARPGDPGAEPGAGVRYLCFFRGDTPFALNLKHPPRSGDQAAFNADFKLLTEADPILALVRANLNKNSSDYRRAEAPPGSPAFQALYSGSSCYLLVPR